MDWIQLAKNNSPREPSFSVKVRKCIDLLSKESASSNYLYNGSSYKFNVVLTVHRR